MTIHIAVDFKVAHKGKKYCTQNYASLSGRRRGASSRQHRVAELGGDPAEADTRWCVGTVRDRHAEGGGDAGERVAED
jgi:hypothetical protein